MKYRGFVDTQYGIGERVRVVENIGEIERDPEHIGAIISDMVAMAGQEIDVVGYCDAYNNDGKNIVWDGRFYWLDDWLEPVGELRVSDSDFDDLWGCDDD